ncbi:hypothetical protein [Archaeoglobus profundus]|uniref:Uncharacterized protein n=1 Tax=Archaeoglobus profundus (strain DSM 5631 / JCM 9629 / NBRC 100127 / Av18) TaxID=572546 RepID=D2RDS8_ARCPA|nr:hypothetical protein [Archaeoglobus profundus]ADB58272.1 hypothetical protein Arcpr_1220 [Archaeoglobus profundus DSM 5631]
MQEDVTLSDILEEIRKLREDVERLERLIRYIIESMLTFEEEETSREVEGLKSKDLSKYGPLEELDDALKREK